MKALATQIQCKLCLGYLVAGKPRYLQPDQPLCRGCYWQLKFHGPPTPALILLYTETSRQAVMREHLAS